MADIPPTMSLYLVWKYQRVWEPDVFLSENIPVSLAAAQWMNKDCKHRKKYIYFEVTWTRSELTAVYWKHLSWIPPEFVVAGDVKRSAGGSITTSWNGYSHLSANDSIFSPPCIIVELCIVIVVEHSWSMALIRCKHTVCFFFSHSSSHLCAETCEKALFIFREH